MENRLATLDAQLAAVITEQQRIDALNALAWELRNRELERGLQLSEEAYQRARQCNGSASSYARGMVESLRTQGSIYSRMGRFELALPKLFEALTCVETDHLPGLKAEVFQLIGTVHWRIANYSEALDALLNALKIAQQTGNQKIEARTFNTLGTVYCKTGEYAQAIAAYERSLAMFRQLADQQYEGSVLNNLAMGYLLASDPQHALPYALQSLALTEHLDSPSLEVDVLDTLGQVYLALGVYEQAQAYFQRSIERCTAVGLKYSIAEALFNLGNVHILQQQPDLALAYAQRALTVAEENEDRRMMFRCHEVLAAIYKQQGNFMAALTHYEQFHTIRAAVFNEQSDMRFQTLQVVHDTETARQQAEIYQLKNVALEQEIAERKRVEADLRAAHEELKATLEYLKRTQTQLVEAEKLADLGKLVANIAHELNTPFAVIRASVENMSRAFRNALAHLPELLRGMSAEQQQLFFVLLDVAIQAHAHLTSREERHIRRGFQTTLVQRNIAPAREIADLLVEMGIPTEIERYCPLFEHTENVAILRAASQLVMQYRNSRHIMTAVERASRVVIALKTFVDADTGTGQKYAVNIPSSLEAVLTVYQHQFDLGIEVVRSYHAIPDVLGYPNELHQIWTHLIHNAIWAMKGTGRLEISVSRRQKAEGSGQLPVSSFQFPEFLVVEITDSGCGIPDEITAHLFEPFFTTKSAGEGSGLGLHICKKIIDKHQGRIEVESQPGRTTFRIWLPILR